MKTIVLATALAFATMPLTFAQAPPAKTDTTKPADKTTKKNRPKKDSGKTSKPAATPAATTTPVKK